MKKVIRQIVYCDDCGTLIDNLSAVESFFGISTGRKKYLGIFIHHRLTDGGHFELIDITDGISRGFYSVGEIKFENYASTTLTMLEKRVSEMIGSQFILLNADENLLMLSELIDGEC